MTPGSYREISQVKRLAECAQLIVARLLSLVSFFCPHFYVCFCSNEEYRGKQKYDCEVFLLHFPIQ